MAATATGISGRNRTSAGCGGTFGLYQLASVITCDHADHTCVAASPSPVR